MKVELEKKGMREEFKKLEVVIRGNYLVKKAWRSEAVGLASQEEQS